MERKKSKNVEGGGIKNGGNKKSIRGVIKSKDLIKVFVG